MERESLPSLTLLGREEELVLLFFTGRSRSLLYGSGYAHECVSFLHLDSRY